MKQEVLMKFNNATDDDVNGRYRSWEHCYKYFADNRKKPDIDTMCLHLGFYLASWGMYRGSSFLLQKDYLVHKPVVELLLEDKYEKLWYCTSHDLLDDNIVNLILDVRARIIKAYENQPNCRRPTDTLVTKILMGTFGCLPAYDSYLIDGIKSEKVATPTLGKKSIKQIANYYIENEVLFEEAREVINKNGVEYPQLKLLDMYFWQIGYDLNLAKKEKE
ncbi:MAG: hypothetical protein Q8O09_04900 [Bacillota bacterium]|nr:hypothetical protein [Bacillota bacterium]